MSRIGKISVEIPSGVEVNVDGQNISVKGPKGTLSLAIAIPITTKVKDNKVMVTRVNDERESRSLHDLTRILVANVTEGAIKGHAKVLEIQGTDYRVTQEGAALEFVLGFSHPVNVEPPEGITFEVKGNRVAVEGILKEQVRKVAISIHRIHPPEPCKGKGMRYLGENVRRKTGKTGKW